MAKLYQVYSERKVRDIKINSTSDLESFLKILAEESVRKTKKDLTSFRIEENAEDPLGIESSYQSDLASRIKSDTARFDEADDDSDESDDVDSEIDVEVEEKPEEEPSEDVAVDYYSMRDEINKIRAGESTKDSDISTPLEKYIMSDLDSDERQAMFTFLASVANIMNKTGTDPADPSDPPSSLNIKRKKDTRTSDQPEDNKKTSQERPTTSQKPTGPEDISPPIKVGSQMKETLRTKVRELMKG